MQWYSLGMMVVWGTILSTVLTAEPQQMSSGETVRVGHQYFVRYCSACHGVEGRGDGPAAPALQPPPADLTRIAQRRGGHLARLCRRRAKPFPVAEIAAYIDGRTSVPAHGRREMPIWGERFGESVGRDMLGEAVVQSHLRVLIAYLQAIQQ